MAHNVELFGEIESDSNFSGTIRRGGVLTGSMDSISDGSGAIIAGMVLGGHSDSKSNTVATSFKATKHISSSPVASVTYGYGNMGEYDAASVWSWLFGKTSIWG